MSQTKQKKKVVEKIKTEGVQGMLFKEGVALRVACVSEREAEKRVTPGGKNVTSCRVRSTGKWGVRFYELTAWDEKADAMEKAITAGGLRLIVIGVPVEDLYKGRIQHKVNVDELWVENIERKSFDEVISKNGVPEEAERVFEPIEVPDEVRM